MPEYRRLLVHPRHLKLLTHAYWLVQAEARQLAFGMRGDRMLASGRDRWQLQCPPLVELPNEGECFHVRRTGGRGRCIDQVCARIGQGRQQALSAVDLGHGLASIRLASRHRLSDMVQRAPQILHISAVHNCAESLLELRVRLRDAWLLLVPTRPRTPSSLDLSTTSLRHIATFLLFSRLHIEMFSEIK